MAEFRYKLEPYKGLGTRYTCPECNKKRKFARYIDTETNEHLGDKVGKCERSDNCAYHYTPKQYFADNGIKTDHNIDVAVVRTKQQDKPVDFIEKSIFEKSLGHSHNNFIQYLTNLVGNEVALSVVNKYKVGTSKKWLGATVFWQIDSLGKIRSGKIMQYNSLTGKRVKQPYDMVTWVHSVLKLKNFNLKQCFFGQHLVSDSEKPIAIVESEKTAIIASIYLPEFTWIAACNKQGLSDEKCNSLKDKKVVLYPDLNAYDEWKVKANKFGFSISDLLEKKATKEERLVGLDLADYLVRYNMAVFRSDLSVPVVNTNVLDHVPTIVRKSNEKKDIIDPVILELYERYSTAESQGKLADHPMRNFIDWMWQGVMIYYHNPSHLKYYLKHLMQIEL